MAEAQPKTCSICGIDVSNKPRSKDAKGRYVCQECVTKARQAQSARTAPAPLKGEAPKAGADADQGANAFLLGMGSKNAIAETGTKACPECGRALTADATICVGCGYSFEKGKRLQVKVIKAKAVPGDKGGKAKGGGGGTNPHTIGFVILLVCAGLAAAAYFVPEMGMAHYIGSMAFSVIMSLWVILLGFQSSALDGLLCWFCGPYQIYFVFAKCESTVVKWLWSCAVLNSIVAMLIQAMSAQGA